MDGFRKRSDRPAGETILQRCYDWIEGSNLNCLGKDEFERIASDLRMTASDFYALAKQGPESAALLEQRMAALDLDPDDVLHSEPGVFHDLQRVCTLCTSHRRCAYDLALAPDNAAWKDYCPNVGTLLALDAMVKSAR